MAAPTPAPPDPFPVVGLGASAGGLEAFEQFFRSVPADLGMAFVLVSHLDPSHESILTEILQRATALPVVEASDQLAVKPDHIYVIPPNRDMTIFHGVLQLSVPDLPRGQRMPIDAFFRSLADDRGNRAMGVVLSGTGSDGTLGLRAIAGEGGVTFVQDPATATYDGMPSSAIRFGLRDPRAARGADARGDADRRANPGHAPAPSRDPHPRSPGSSRSSPPCAPARVTTSPSTSEARSCAAWIAAWPSTTSRTSGSTRAS